MPVIVPFVRSEAVSVWLPTVPRITLKARKPFVSTLVSGVFAAPSPDVTRTLSPLGSGFHQLSVACTEALNARPAVWVTGLPVRPETLPGSAVSPGTRIWSRANSPG